MSKPKKAKVEIALANVRITEKNESDEKNAAQRQRAALGAKLRSIRLAKEKADAEVAENKQFRLPQVHRR